MTGKSSPVAVTKSERLLSWILAGFLLLALSWAYVNIDDKVRDSRYAGQAELYDAIGRIYDRQEDHAKSLGLRDGYVEGIFRVRSDLDEARLERSVARERYRTTLDEGAPSPGLKRAYLAADARVEALEAKLERFESKQSSARKKLRVYNRTHRAEERRAEQRLESYDDATERLIFIYRLLMALATLGLSVWLLRWVTERSPRAQPLAQAGVIASSLMLLTLIIDYSEISFDFETVGPLGMALLGVILTVGAFFGLQRYLRNRRPNRRLRSGECAACGYPGGTDYCENCGEQLTTKCSECGESRRTGTGHCRACGAA